MPYSVWVLTSALSVVSSNLPVPNTITRPSTRSLSTRGLAVMRCTAPVGPRALNRGFPLKPTVQLDGAAPMSTRHRLPCQSPT
jgi:hypothetical protein